MERNLFNVFKMVVGGLVVVAIIMLCVHACSGYKEPTINKVEIGVRMNLYSDTTNLCYKDGPYYTAIRNDSSEVNGLTPCFRCGNIFDKHHSSLEWAMKEAAASNN